MDPAMVGFLQDGMIQSRPTLEIPEEPNDEKTTRADPIGSRRWPLELASARYD